MFYVLLKPDLENFKHHLASSVATAEFGKFAGILSEAL